MSSFQTAADIVLHVRSENSSSERRVNPSWSIAAFKTRLEPITGIPSSAQRLRLKLPGAQPSTPIEGADEESTQLSSFAFQTYAEIIVTDMRPPAARLNLDASSIPKYSMSTPTYEALPSTVLAWKKAQKLGRFDPSLPDVQAQQEARIERDIGERDIEVGARCRLLAPTTETKVDDDRRGTVAFIGRVQEIPGLGAWVGIALDEPVGKNDGTVAGVTYFKCAGKNYGVFVRPERVEIGGFAILDELGDEFEEI